MWQKQLHHARRAVYFLSAMLLCIAAVVSPIARAATGEYEWNKAPIASGDRMPWSSIAIDSTGTKILAASGEPWNGGSLYVSTDSGATWTRQGAGERPWQAVATSADGTKFVAVDGYGDTSEGGYIYTSYDGGATWGEHPTAGIHPWQAVASSADGARLAAVEMHYDESVSTYVGSVYTSSNYGGTWTEQTGAGAHSWRGVASSADGSRLVAVGSNRVYISTDYGVSWTEQTGAGSHLWTSVASSADGSRLIAGTSGQSLYISTDYGGTWTEQTGSDSIMWSSVAVSADGTRFVAGGQNVDIDQGYFYVSTDAGAHWNIYEKPSTSWIYVASNANGSVIGAANFYGPVRLSTDSGVTWQEKTVVGAMVWTAMASSSDGSTRVVVDQTGYIYLSHDTGATWQRVESLGAQPWNSVASSADGMKLVAVDGNGVFYASSDSGATWTQQAGFGGADPRAIASSADGAKLVVVGYYGGIYTSVDSGTTWEQRAPDDSLPGHQRMVAASSADGTKLATTNDGYIYLSNDSGATWTEQTDAGTQDWRSIAISADGVTFAAASSGGGVGSIYLSTDSGATWIENANSPAGTLNAIALSSDGTKLVTAIEGGSVYISTDAGETWQEQTSLPNTDAWKAVTISSDGTVVGASTSPGYVYTGVAPGTSVTTVHDYASNSVPSGAGSAVTSAKLRITSLACTSIVNGSTAVFPPTGLTVPDSNVTLLGGIGYSLACATNGESANATVTLGTYYSDLTKLRVYKKSASSSTLTDITSRVTMANTTDALHTPITTISYTLVDGEDFDEDGVANGTIVDPMYVGVSSSSTGSSSGTLAPTGEGQALFLLGGIALLGFAALLLRVRSTLYI